MPDLCGDIHADSFTGAILAVEGVRDAATLLNGPTGCKFYHGGRSERQFPRAGSFDPLRYAEEFYFGQPRVPCTYLDTHDYVFGSGKKLRDILLAVADRDYRMIAVVNSPGAALIGDDLDRFIADSGLDVPCVVVENAGFSRSIADGYQKAVISMLDRLIDPAPISSMDTHRVLSSEVDTHYFIPPTDRPNSAGDTAFFHGHPSSFSASFSSISASALNVDTRCVNLLGISIGHRYWEGDLLELSRLLLLCGIKVSCSVCADCSVESLRYLGQADANVIVYEEYARDIVAWLHERTGIMGVHNVTGAPVGFESTGNWIRKVCDELGADPGPALEDIDSHRRRAYDAISRFNSLTGLPKGATFGIRADASVALPLTKWMYEYLGMVPVAVELKQDSGSLGDALRLFLGTIRCSDAWNRPIERCAPDIVLVDGIPIIRTSKGRPPAPGIGIGWPDSGRVEILPRAIAGASGSLFLLEEVLNRLLILCA